MPDYDMVDAREDRELFDSFGVKEFPRRRKRDEYRPDREPDRVIIWSLMRMVEGNWSWFTSLPDAERLAWIIGENVADHVEVQSEIWGNTIYVWDVQA